MVFDVVLVNFEKQFNKLTGLKLDTVYLLSVFLSCGTTVSTFPMYRKVNEIILLFMTTDKGFERNPEANLTNLIGNLSMPAPFFRFKNFKNFFYFSTSY